MKTANNIARATDEPGSVHDLATAALLALASAAPYVATAQYGYVAEDTASPFPHAAAWAAPFAVLWNGAHVHPRAFHIALIVAHTVATLLLWNLFRRAVGRWGAAAGALWFAVHPVHVEAVASLASMTDVFVGLWLLLVLHALGADLRAPRRFLGALVLCAMAVGARFTLVGHVLPTSQSTPGLDGLSFTNRLWAELALGGRMATLLFWPTGQSPHYGPSVLPATQGATIPALITILVLAIALVASVSLLIRKRDGRPLAALAWMVLALIPASNLVVTTGEILSERMLYIASMGAALLVAWAVHMIVSAFASQRIPVAVVATAMALAATRGAIATHRYANVWKDHLHLFSYMTASDPAGYRGYRLLAMEMDRRGRSDRAVGLYERALAMVADDPRLSVDYVEFLLKRKRASQAYDVARRLAAREDLADDQRVASLVVSARAAIESDGRVGASGRR